MICIILAPACLHVEQVLNEEFVGFQGQQAWSSVMQSLGDEYVDFASLAHTQEDQVEWVMGDLGFRE